MQNTGKTSPGSGRDSAYVELLKAFPPRPITSEEELTSAQKAIDALIDRAELTPDERAYLSVLGTLVREYEQIHYPMPDIHGVELIQALLAEFNLAEKDLVPIFGTEEAVSEVLGDRRELTVTQIEKLADFFQVSAADFLSQR